MTRFKCLPVSLLLPNGVPIADCWNLLFRIPFQVLLQAFLSFLCMVTAGHYGLSSNSLPVAVHVVFVFGLVSFFNQAYNFFITKSNNPNTGEQDEIFVRRYLTIFGYNSGLSFTSR